ncbi:MAG: SPFH domain-containing protein [Oscillospiraceae bacterium]|nr:SPFH domain-containing protein [Oscillospiraceae bacterium]
MAKFVIECPNCGKYAEARTGFFARKKIDCSCGHTINVRTEKLAGRECPHCGNMVVFDQSKGEKAKCPVCHEPINTQAEQTKMEEFSCAQCGVRLRTSKSASTYTCPVCDFVNDVPERLMSEKIKKDGLASIIKYEGDNETLIWKHPIEDFNYGSQLIVHESQEAIFFRDGQALDLFGAGRYTLETQQLPLLEKLYQLPTDTEGTFHSEVYFINKVVQMAIKWGTPEKVRFIDPLTGVPLELGASGEMNLRVSDSRKLLLKLVGTMKGIAWEDQDGMSKSLQSSFRPLITTAVKTNLSAVIKDNAIDLLEIDEKLDLISDRLREKLVPGFEEYGLTIPQFYVTHVVLPENDPNFKRIRELHTITLQTRVIQAEATVKTAQAQSEAQYKTAQAQAKAQYRTAEEQSAAAIEAAHREAVLQQQTTETEVARRAAERQVIAAQAEAQAQRMAGLTEAEIMAAKGYSQKDVLQSEVQKAYAEGIGNMGPAISAGGGSGILGDMLGLGVGMAAAQAVAPQIGDMMQGFRAPAAAETPAGGWDCPACGNKSIIGKFCPECGAKKPEPAQGWTCPGCGKTGVTSKFCPECGAKKPEPDAGWTCPSCGKTGITSKFCPECGAKKPEPDAGWTCPDCGTKGIKTAFCPECGHKKDE